MAKDQLKNQDLLEAQLTAMVEVLVEELELGWMDVSCRFNPMAPSEGEIAETVCLPQYREATLTFYLKQCATKSTEYMEATIIHELVHIAVADMEQLVREVPRRDTDGLREKQCERAVENVSRMIIAARKKRG